MSKKKLVLSQIDSYYEFKEKFYKMFGITWDVWSKNATHDGDGEMAEWYDDKITAGCSTYDERIKVYA